MSIEGQVRGDGDTPSPSFALGTTTAIGSLPHRDRAAAVAFALETTPGLPAAPTVPQLEPRESMIPQAAWAVPGISVQPDGTIRVDARALDPEAPLGDAGLLGAPFTTLHAFLHAVSGRNEPIKLQLTGPVTFGMALRAEGVPDAVAFAVAAAAVRERARHLVTVARAAAPHAPLVVFLDEPCLALGPTGGIPLPADRVIDLVSGALAALEADAVTGVHCCGAADWRALLHAGPQVLSLPVHAGITASAGALSSFLDRGGWVAWGAVPTDGPLGELPSRLWRVLSAQWCELVQAGCDPVRLRHQALVTPECGLALHNEVQADHVLGLTRQIAERLQDQVSNVKLSVGA